MTGTPQHSIYSARELGWWSAWKAAAVVFLFSRTVVFAAAYFAPLFLPEQYLADMPESMVHTGLPRLLDALVRWDAWHYILIARDGYAAGSTVWDTNIPFLPLYPWLMGLLGVGGGVDGLAVAGLLISNTTFFVALAVLYRLTAQDFGPAIARRCMLYLAIFPTSFFLSAPYTESLFLLLTLGFFWALRGGKWPVKDIPGMEGASRVGSDGTLVVQLLALIFIMLMGNLWLGAAVFGGLAALTRLPGALLVVVYLFEWYRRRADAGTPGWAWILASLIPTGTLIYMLTLQLSLGDPFFWHSTLSLWKVDYGAQLLDGGLKLPGVEVLFPAAVTALFVLAGLRGSRTWLPAYRVWFWLYFLVVLGLSFTTQGPFYSFIRFALLAFPAFFVFAQWGEQRWFHLAYVAVSLLLLTISTMLFSQWYWVA